MFKLLCVCVRDSLKMVRLYKDPNGDTIFSNLAHSAKPATGLEASDRAAKIVELEKRVKTLESSISSSKVCYMH